MQSEPQIEYLLSAARAAAVAAHEGQPAHDSQLKSLAAYARNVVLAQADCGMWRPWAVQSASDFQDLTCEALVTTSLVDGQYIELRWSFMRTKLRYLETHSQRIA